jgi:hypothetical protein
MQSHDQHWNDKKQSLPTISVPKRTQKFAFHTSSSWSPQVWGPWRPHTSVCITCRWRPSWEGTTVLNFPCLSNFAPSWLILCDKFTIASAFHFIPLTGKIDVCSLRGGQPLTFYALSGVPRVPHQILPRRPDRAVQPTQVTRAQIKCN